MEDLLAVVFSDPMRLGPTAEKIIEWVEMAFDKEARRRGRTHSTEDAFVAANTPMRLHLEWRNGTIDAAQSYVIQPQAGEVRAYAEVGNTGKTIDQILAGAPVAVSEPVVERLLPQG